ncbi:MAG: dihydropteroate synthase [Thermodesulfobacteriota bacterium]|nr:dihydropteroate synthase [Thermodesulfobacteriota bacterium]
MVNTDSGKDAIKRISCKKGNLNLDERTHIMGILNITPDSFSDGGLFCDPDLAVTHALKLVDDGADIIDVGGETTKPGSKPISADQELARVIPVVKRLSKMIDVPLSIDTYKSAVAKRAIEAGAEMINDISALRFDPDMKVTAAKYGVPIVLMHMKGTPLNMQKDPRYEFLISEIIGYLKESIEIAQKAGIHPDRIIIDPGIGFGKSIKKRHNLEIIRRLSEFETLGMPILIGPSRKAFIGEILGTDVTQREEGTVAAVCAAVLNGANIIRVHNVGMIKRAVKIIDAIKI